MYKVKVKGKELLKDHNAMSRGFGSFGSMKLFNSIGKMLRNSISEKEEENSRLKKIIVDMENMFNFKTLFT